MLLSFALQQHCKHLATPAVPCHPHSPHIFTKLHGNLIRAAALGFSPVELRDPLLLPGTYVMIYNQTTSLPPSTLSLSPPFAVSSHLPCLGSVCYCNISGRIHSPGAEASEVKPIQVAFASRGQTISGSRQHVLFSFLFTFKGNSCGSLNTIRQENAPGQTTIRSCQIFFIMYQSLQNRRI